MSKVISLAERREENTPHLSGEAFCLNCKAKWVQVSPVGVVWSECPECHSMKGLMKWPVERDGLQWVCNCGNNLFHITPDGYYCPNCGVWQDPQF
jgi:Zn finger protein HypA/HybF involved in hydrogenase expression